MLSNLSNNNAGNQTKSVIEKKHYEAIEDRLDELQDEIEMTEQGVSTNSQAIASLDERIGAVEDNSTFPTLNTDVINPATGDKIDVTGNLDVDGNITADTANFSELSVNNVSFTTVANDAALAKSVAENAKNKANDAYILADAVADELADYKADNEQSITTGTLDADSVIADSIATQTINTNDFETTNAEVDKLYVDTIRATGFLELPTVGQSYYTITIPAKTTASFSGIYVASNDTEYPYYFTVSDGAVIYKQNSTEIIKDISFDRETGNTKVRVKSSTNLTYISTALDNNPVTIEDGGNAYTDYAFIPQKTGGYLIRGYDDTTTEIYIAGVLRAYAMSVEEEIIERTSVDFLKINASIELPKEWDAGGTISYSTGEENQYISAQTKAGVTKPTWTSPIHSTIGSLSYSSKLVDEATVASYKGISETRQTQTISITNEASLQQLTAFHWTKNGTYWQPYELTRITIGDNTMWIDPTEANQGIRFSGNQVIADGTWDDVPVEEANAVPVNLVIFDAPTELSFPITNLGDRTTVHGEITATCFKGDVLGNVTGNADTATNATCFSNKTYAEAKTDILSGCAADSNMFNGKTYSEACADILSGNAATATNATCFDGKTYAEAKADILSGCSAAADNATCFDGHTYADAKADILSGNAASATNATCFNSKTYSEAKADILSGTAAQAHCVDIDSLTTNSYPLVMESTTCELGKSGTCPITFTPSSGVLETNQVSTSCIENNGTTKSQYLCATCDINVDGNAYITGDLTVQGTITTTHSEEVVTPSENIILRDGATTPIASGCYSGFTVTNYDGQDNNLEIGADKDGTLHVGVVGETMEPIATRATEACMENGYAAHWDSTGTDLVTKGATNTHDLTVNGNASVTGDLSVTGTLTADLTGTADNATKFNGCTYEQAKSDILSGCAADSAKLGDKDPSCYIDTSATTQTKAGHLCIGAPSACTPTSDGGNGVCINSNGVLELYQTMPYIDFHYNRYCCDYSTRFINRSQGRFSIDVNNGTGCTAATTSNTFDFYSDGTFKGATNICGTNIYQSGNKVIDASSTAQCKSGNLSIGAPSACTTTSAGGQGTFMSNTGVIDLFRDSSPYVDFHYQKYCGDFSSRIVNIYATNSCNGILRMTVNNGKGCTASDTANNFDFYSDGTFSGASKICASCNIYSAGCPVVTTGTLPTVAPGYNCTGTSNYVVTTMVCCAKQICRNQVSTAGNYRLALFDDDTSCSCANVYVSSACPIYYNPSTGELKTRTISDCLGTLQTSKTQVTATNIGLTAGECYPLQTVIDCLLHCYGSKPAVYSFAFANASNPYICEGSMYAYNYRIEKLDSNDPVNVNWQKTQWKVEDCTGRSWTVSAYVGSTADSITWKTVENISSVSYVGTSSCNAEYPLVFSTCCATPVAGNRTLYNDSANNLMYNPSSNTLTTTCVRGSCRVIVGYPTGCTSTQAGNGGAVLGGGICLYHATPFVDFHHNNACADYSHRIIANNGYLRVTATNATGCTPSTQTAYFDFKSDGTLKATGDVQAKNTVRRGEYYNMSDTDVGKYVLLAQASYAYNGNHDIALTGSLANSSVMLNKFALTARVSGAAITNYAFRLLYGISDDYKATYEYDSTTYTLTVRLYAKLTYQYQRLKIAIDSFTKGDVYPFTSPYDSGLTLPMTLSATMAGTEITTTYVTVNNSTCFNGCTYAQAKADIAGSVETTPYTCINDVNSGAQDILMTSSTGTLGIVNASTGTNACPLKYNPSTGVLTACSFIVCSNNTSNPACYKPLAVVSETGTSLGKGATAIKDDVYGVATAIGYEALACCGSIVVGPYAKATSVSGIAIGSGSCSCGAFGIAIGEGADTFAKNGIALGISSRAACRDAIAIGNTACGCNENAIAIGYYACANGSCDLAIGHCAYTNGNSDGLAIFKDIRYSGFRETTFCIPDSATESDVYLVLSRMFCTNPAEGCPGYGHNVWPAYGIDGCSGCFYNRICSGRWGAGQQCCFFSLGSHTFTQGCAGTVGCNMFVTVIAPVK